MSQLLIWYDGACPLCRREIALMRLLDRREAICFVDISSGESSCPVDRKDALARFHASEDGHILSGAAAFAAMWRHIPILRPLGIAARNATVLAVLESLYTAFLRVRPAMQSAARWLERRARAAKGATL
jgi:predicted DCC family thiol-disulfide oxidoreductase YuxK